MVIAFASFAYSLFTIIANLIYFREFAAPGIPTLIAAVFFFSGVQLAFLGVLGEYISAIHFQVRKRPLVIERERINFDGAASVQARRRIVRAGAACPANLSRAKVIICGSFGACFCWSSASCW